MLNLHIKTSSHIESHKVLFLLNEANCWLFYFNTVMYYFTGRYRLWHLYVKHCTAKMRNKYKTFGKISVQAILDTSSLYPQPLSAVLVLFSPLVSRSAGVWQQ